MDSPQLPFVLLVNDHADLRDVLRVLLETEGFRVEIAGDGAEALRKLRGGLRPFAILIDLRMPVLNGEQFREEQLKDKLLARIPVIFHSADYDARDTAGRTKAAAFVRLPDELDRLCKLLRRHRDAPRGARSAAR